MGKKILLTHNDLASIVAEAVEKIISSKNSDKLYHFTKFENCYQILYYNSLVLSTPNAGFETELIDDYRNYASFTNNGNIETSSYPQQQTRFFEGNVNSRIVIDKKIIDYVKDSKFHDIQYKLEKAKKVISGIRRKKTKDREFKSTIQIFINMNFEFPDNLEDLSEAEINDLEKRLYRFSMDWDEEETRLLTKTNPLIKDVYQYIINVDFVCEKKYSTKYTMEKMAKALSKLPNYDLWKDKIRFFQTASDMDNEINAISVEEILEKVSNELTDDDIDFIKKYEDVRISKTDIGNLATILYIVSYTNKGIERIKNKIKTLLDKYKLADVDIVIVVDDKDTKSKTRTKTKLGIEILSQIDDIHVDYSQLISRGDTINLFQHGNSIFGRLTNKVKNAKFILAQICTIYNKWLDKYQDKMNSEVSNLKNDLNGVLSIGGGVNRHKLISFAKKYTYVFYKIFKGELESPIFRQFTDYVSGNINNINEDKEVRPSIDFSTTMGFVNSVMYLLNFMGFNKIKNKIIDEFKQEVYRADELIYFKKSVMVYKNKNISEIKSLRERFGDLAKIKNNADVANSETDTFI